MDTTWTLSQRVSRAKTWVTTNALKRTWNRDDDKPKTRKAEKGNNAHEWRDAIAKEITALERTKSFNVIKALRDKIPLHTQFVFKGTMMEKRSVKGAEHRWLFAYKDYEVQENSFITKGGLHSLQIHPIFSLHRLWNVRHVHFENSFPNECPDRLVIPHLPRHL